MQELTDNYHSFKSTVRSLNVFLNDLPSNKISSEDSVTQISAKKKSQQVSVV